MHLASFRRTPKVLLVVAHPDDEYAVAATVYRITHELGGTVDQFVVTNGEGGFRYSHLAEAIYRTALSDEAIGCSRLPQIRRREALEAGKILGIRNHIFLGQRDSSFTTDGGEPLDGLWDCELISSRLRKVLNRERYDCVFVLLPTPDTHGHHQAVASLATAAVMTMSEEIRPVVLGAHPSSRTVSPLRFRGHVARFAVDRQRAVAPGSPLTYSVVVNWVVAAHKSQGLFQTEIGKHQEEQFWLLATGADDATTIASDLFILLEPAPRALHAHAC